jgi:Holliday junction DNA helicase RuvA
MIARLRGEISDLKPTELVLDVGGVGYRVSIPFSTFEKIRSLREVTLHVHTYHREDSFRLFGFWTAEEKSIFLILLGISGIGPAMALSLLSGISIGALLAAVREENPGILMKVPGIGKSKADKLIFELKRRVKKLESFTADRAKEPSVRNDAVEALVSLGFDEKRSALVVDSMLRDNPGMPIEELVRASLKQFAS